MELLTIILKAVQILSMLVLTVIALTLIAIKIKSKSKVWNFSNHLESKTKNQIYKDCNNEISLIPIDTESKAKNNVTSKNSNHQSRNTAYTVYNPKSNPRFYTHQRLNWYKNFD